MKAEDIAAVEVVETRLDTALRMLDRRDRELTVALQWLAGDVEEDVPMLRQAVEEAVDAKGGK